MSAIRSLASTRSTMHGVFLTFTAAFVLIASLLAMHTLSTGDDHLESDAVAIAAAAHDQAPQAAVNNSAVDAGYCAGECGAPGNTPGHALLLMVCALALLAAATVVLAPALLARLSMSLGLAVLVRDSARALAPARPPSLLVLSVSRT